MRTIQLLATNIKYYRKQREWTQQQLADNLNISRSVIAKWENGDVLPDLQSLIKLSDIFQQTIEHLTGIHPLTEHILNEFKQTYAVDYQDEQVTEALLPILDYIMKEKLLMEQIKRMQTLPIKKQKAIHRMLKSIITETERS